MLKLIRYLNFIALGLLASVLTCVIGVRVWPHVHAVAAVQAQGNTKTVIINQLYRTDPIEVVKVLAAGKEAEVGIPSQNELQWLRSGLQVHEWRAAYRLQSDDNWLSNLSFVLRNRTSKRIDYVEVDVQIPYTGGAHALFPKSGSDFPFGRIPAAVWYDGRTGEPLPPTTRDPIHFDPGQTMTFALADAQYGLSQLLANAQPLSANTMCSVQFRVVLEDGLEWSERLYTKPDPEHRGRYVVCRGDCFPDPLSGPPAR